MCGVLMIARNNFCGRRLAPCRSDLRSGEMLEERGMLDEATTVYGRCLDTCVAKIGKFANGQINMQAIEDREAAIDKLTKLTIRFLSDGNFEQARKAIDSALAVRPDAPTLNIYRAHVLMFLDRERRGKGALSALCRRKGGSRPNWQAAHPSRFRLDAERRASAPSTR